MKHVKRILVVIGFFSIFNVHGQQDPQYTQYMYNQSVLNPAYAGQKETLAINLLGRTQWVGIDGAPDTATLSIHSPIGSNIGLGGTIIHDQIGPVTETNAYADVSYTINTSEEGRLALGLKGGVTFHNIDRNLLQTVIQNDNLINQLEEGNQTLPNFGAGVFYYTQKFYVGLSVPNILETNHFEKSNGIISEASEKMHFFGTLGVVFDLSDNIKLKPSAMVKAAVGAPVSIDLSANALFNDEIEFGLSYRFDDSISAIIGFNIDPDFRIGYAYDYTLSKLGDYNSGSHEIMLNYEFNRRNLKSPRFF